MTRPVPRDRDRADATFRAAFDHAPIGMALVDLDGRFTRVNPALCEMLGYDAGDLEGRRIGDISHPADADAASRVVRRLAAGEMTSHRAEHRCLTASGRSLWVEVSGTAVADADGRPEQVVAQIVDIGLHKLRERALRAELQRDDLTGLGNRRRFIRELARYDVGGERHGEVASVLALDLDGFKEVNDRLGHAAGDDLLRAVGATLRARLRASDVVARIGGDEFAVVLPSAPADAALRVARDLLTAVEQTRVSGPRGEVVSVSASVGVAPIGEGGTAEALGRADAAMYTAKRLELGVCVQGGVGRGPGRAAAPRDVSGPPGVTSVGAA